MRPRFTLASVFLATTLLPLTAPRSAQGAVILFQDSFEAEVYVVDATFPGGGTDVPWTDNVTTTTNPHLLLRVEDDKASDGSKSVFFRDGDNRNITTLATIGSRIDVTGWDTVIVRYDVAQQATDYEAADHFTLAVNFGGAGFVNVFRSTDNLTGEGTEEAPVVYNGTLITDDFTGAGNASGDFFTYYVQLDVSAVDYIQIRYNTFSGSTNENWWLDNVQVLGVVPEAGPAALLVLAGLGFVLRRRR